MLPMLPDDGNIDIIDHVEEVDQVMDVGQNKRQKGINKRKMNKTYRMVGKQYVSLMKDTNGNKKVKPERILTERGCSKRCESRNQCGEFSEEDRTLLFDSF